MFAAGAAHKYIMVAIGVQITESYRQTLYRGDFTVFHEINVDTTVNLPYYHQKYSYNMSVDMIP